VSSRPHVQAAFDRLDAWVAERDYAGWDPHDALNSPVFARVAGNHKLAGQVMVQVVKRSPVNFRRLFGVRAGRNPKAIGLFLASYCRQYQRAGTAAQLATIKSLAGWLEQNRSKTAQGAGWGYNFAWPNRSFYAPAGTPTVVNTSFIGLGFVQMHDVMAVADAEVAAQALATAREACRFVLGGLKRLHETADELCLSYTPIDRRVVHNANLLAGWLLAEVGRRTGDRALLGDAQRIARFASRRQLAGGSWPYGDAAQDQFVDSFHTAYVLMALRHIGRASGTGEFDDGVSRGFTHWRMSFFRPDGLPRYYRDRDFPIDSHCAAVAILTLLEFAEVPDTAPAANRITDWLIEHMQDPSGYFYYQRTRSLTNRIPYMRWVQAWVHRCLSEVLAQKGATS
jgi:hypothetical protein